MYIGYEWFKWWICLILIIGMVNIWMKINRISQPNDTVKILLASLYLLAFAAFAYAIIGPIASIFALLALIAFSIFLIKCFIDFIFYVCNLFKIKKPIAGPLWKDDWYEEGVKGKYEDDDDYEEESEEKSHKRSRRMQVMDSFDMFQQQEFQRQHDEFTRWSMNEAMKASTPFEMGGYDMTQGNSFNNDFNDFNNNDFNNSLNDLSSHNDFNNFNNFGNGMF